MRGKPVFLTLLMVLGFAFFARPVLAHYLWLNPDNYFPAVGSTVSIGIGWGHTYPADRHDDTVPEERFENIVALDPDGQEVPLGKVSTAEYRLKIEKAGAYIVTARIKSGFKTLTPEGRKWGNKQEVADAVKCINFHLEARAVLLAGADTSGIRLTGQTLELRPLNELSSLKSGDKLAVELLYEGKPLAGTAINATYAGYVDPNAPQPAAKGHHHAYHYPVSAVTDGQGRAELPLDTAGYWLLMFSHKPPYPDPAVCDACMYNMTFTCEVR
ncbi:MAG: DUF4198 domain-containing protein [Deltaproteobacteria bacterium]|nr:DUF4198 domain-containing protein [Candidatus Anaeroferrophillacea bacterium]